MSLDVDVLCDVQCGLGEGPRWYDGVLTWVDIEGRAVHRWDGRHSMTMFDAMVGCANPTDDGDLVVALADRIELASTGEVLARFPHGPDLRANDGACDATGRLWVGTMPLDEKRPVGALYRLDASGLTPIFGGLTVANGIGWSPDGSRMYYIDTPTRRIDAFAYDGEVGEGVTFAEIDGWPDGLALDDEGCVWVAVYGGARVERWTPEGELDRVVPTACCFGDGLLYITSGRAEGRIYVCDAGVSGPPAQPFRRTAPSDAEPTSAR
jgi:sugar lactone lactonase YvrE